ncbi:UDP-N-acetylmuramate--L-alanine ligase [Herbinix luporum]|jgi:UDP-N-acetylmuramate--alanine ligase|uniref:UDP-N-acetylmuramate--L-alanine ligase n=1 Tax=Herbinix luporum TaxID=1679721 RepID=A0A0K8J945_9FIRM|nr:UDP-N-acetylmuramate--L-alanine ligase [Herbinix luporum]MDI9489665.1 UDP-N-acetylmuramate--L-alanine ligase [Bacillota bacterium]CUH93817.1 UDP-N-acetylmuramate-L-alanine ligase [Herbinix luporum]HHT57592.1 UDP-N-acetylmuramate--L-alanine ligase [Herbinix luporum]
MYKIDFNKPCRIHFIGIGGISMSGFAEYLHNLGFKVSGSDSHKSKITQDLNELGIEILYGQRKSNITPDIDVVVYTAAIKSDNEEFMAVNELGIPKLNRAQLIGQIMEHFDNAVAVSGTHGKTTVTSMLSLLFIDGNLDPTISIGGILDAIGGNMRIGNSGHFITEACEYMNSFLEFKPKKAIILNIDEDHMDFFKDLDDIRNSFHLFAKKIPKDGQLYINGEIANYEEITKDLECEVLTYGITDPAYGTNYHLYDIRAENIKSDNLTGQSFDLYYKDKFIDRIMLKAVGIHNISNSLPAIGIALNEQIPIETIKNSLKHFKCAHRRFQYKGTIGGVNIVDDYAHHPTEITATLTAAKTYTDNTLWCVFQPHTFSRTKRHLKDFAKSLSLADKIVLADIYAAREKDPGDISSKDLANELKKLGKEVYYFPSFDEIENFLLENCINGDLLITMGAGDIVTVGESLLGK